MREWNDLALERTNLMAVERQRIVSIDALARFDMFWDYQAISYSEAWTRFFTAL
jgi:hypothetical protein